MFTATLKSKPDEDISILVQLDNHSEAYLCDCGEASLLTPADCLKLAAVFISHTHIDHFVNFDTLLRHQLGSGKTVVICGPPQLARQVQARILSYTWNLSGADDLCYEVRELIDEGQYRRFQLRPPEWNLEPLGTVTAPVVYDNERFSVQAVILDHKTPSVAWLFREADSSNIDLSAALPEQFPDGLTGGPWVRALKMAADRQDIDAEITINGRTFRAQDLFYLINVKRGDTLGVILDHAAHADNHRKIQAAFTGCRKVLIEAYYLEADRELAERNAHSYSKASATVLRACGVEEAVPVHFSRKYGAEEVEVLRREFEGA